MFLHWLKRPCVIIPCCMFTISVLSGLSTLTVHEDGCQSCSRIIGKYTSLSCIVQIRSLISYTGIIVACFFLGFAEAPFFPGIVFLISCI
ncbi:uncharacterized protein F5147DRAFT_725982 [Suillus discolor]|uniref:Uncharacterized protein n=1 Tax=Suillus discolor TaxID=1912936 RepID=A0A9P7EUH5_9AGAM|nr:uncharacterized protein F5147DRAFT_725982 [Suillus discolor]KAG2089321.1 hypothetical protein F5147DRAFT_725982 [Suillus discolor]